MRFIMTSALIVSTLAGCQNLTREEQVLVGGLTGAAAGVITADAFDADRNWTIISALTGAAVGTVVASNNATQQCAYALGDGTYRLGPCP